jgi:Tfp pilus assembly protein PilV
VSRVGDERGMSLVEVAVASLLLMLLLLPLLRFFDSSVAGAGALQASNQLQADGRLVVDRLTRELRQAYTGTDALAPVTVTGEHLTVYSPDTATPFHLRRIDYEVTDGVLRRSTTSSIETSCPDMAAPCDASGHPSVVDPPWTFGPAGPWVDVLPVRDDGAPPFALVGEDGRSRVDITLTGTNVPGRADRAYTTSVELRNA